MSIQAGKNLMLCYGSGGTVYVGATPVSTTYKMYVNGSAYATGSWATASDRRMKDQIEVITGDDAVAKIMGLRPSTWVWNENNAYLYGKRGAGLIAQEVQPILPFSVVEDEWLALDYQDFHPYEVAMLQNHESRIAVLEAENKELKAKLKEYESR